MTPAAEDLLKIADELPREKFEALIEFARFLRSRGAESISGDLEWERIINGRESRPKLDRFVAEALAEEPSESLDVGKL